MQSTRRPNILWISCEDISPRLGCYGDPVARTPNLDRLAEQGMRFTKVFTSSPVCAPCRSGIITGMYQTSIGTHHMRTTHKGEGLPTPYSAVPPPYVKTFTEYLRAEGYYCTNNSKTDYQFTTPVTAWDESSNKAHYRNRPDKNQPFFAVFNLTMTHESQNWLEPEVTDPATVEVPPYYPDTMVVRKDIARLYDNIAAMDKRAGEILKELEDDGLADDTIVFFWSDHGDGLPRAKRWVYDSGTHIPLIVRWPGHFKPGSINDDLISSIDFGPTVLSLAGTTIPMHIQGQPFLGTKAKPAREYVFSARDRFDESYDMVRSVRDKRYRYIRNFYPEIPYIIWIPYRNRGPAMQEMLRLHAEGKLAGPQKLWFSNRRPPEELYDCQADPHQIDNLADNSAYNDVLERMSEVLDEWRRETKDMGDISEELMVNQMWPGGIQPETAQPKFIPNAHENRGTSLQNGGTFTGPITVSIYCATQGASIAYTAETGENPHWLLYTGPIRLTEGTTVLRAKAIRYGYKESREIVGGFTVSP
ncbi:TPA: sulfatase [Candidatus Poribacteria bacterium]|nr:sulfatase [Candidatus Poribacteria bacterium]